MTVDDPLYSKTRVNRAGQRLCDLLDVDAGPSGPIDDDLFFSAFSSEAPIVEWWRQTHRRPLHSVQRSLRSFVKTLDLESAQISQRWKRLDRILLKMLRSPQTMQLANMQDIGGTRVVVPTLDDLELLRSHIRTTWEPRYKLREIDYRDNPTKFGYRAVHLVVVRNERRIEVQLRTRLQHEWADSVERLGRTMDLELKSGLGDPVLLNYLRILADRSHAHDAGIPEAPELLEEYNSARSQLEGRATDE